MLMFSWDFVVIVEYEFVGLFSSVAECVLMHRPWVQSPALK
jgi:hypothetical protein